MPEKPLPNYETVPLRQDETTVGVIQFGLYNSRAEAAREDNAQHIVRMGNLIRRDMTLGHMDLVCFHESPITGMNLRWNKEDWLKVAIDIPGPETDQIGELAKKFNCYIAFGCYAKLPEWPGHFINMGLIVSPSGEIVLKSWKRRNLSGFADLGTTVYDVLDQYVEMYGWDAIFPVARTDIGNLAFMPEVMEPETGRVFGMKGAEILIRFMTMGAGYWSTAPMALRGARGGLHTMRLDLQAVCLASGIFGVFANDALMPAEDGPGYDVGAGHSAIFDHDGMLLSEVSTQSESTLSAIVPVGPYRKRHSVPRFPKELFAHAYDNYEPRYPTNSYAASQPQSLRELSAHYKGIARW
jgi:predicted amidohydrolase